MKRKTISGLLTFVLAAGTILAGCGDSSEKPAVSTSGEKIEEGKLDTSESVEEDQTDVNDDGTVNNPEAVQVDKNKLVFWSLFSGGDGEFMDKIISDYNGTRPTKQVQSIMLVWADYYTKLQTAVAAGKGPDIGVSHASSLPELVEQGAVQPLDDYLDEIGVDLKSMYTETSLESVTFDGSIYAIPLDTHAEIMYFNKDILEQAGVSLNEKGQIDIGSIDDFYAVCDKIQAVIPEGGSVISLTSNGDDPYRVWWASYFQMGGSPLINKDASEVTLDKDIAVKAAEFTKSLYEKGYVAEGIDDHQQFFQSGKAGIYIGGTWGTGALEKTENLGFGAMPYPQMFDENACWADSHTLILPTKKDRSEEDSKAAVEFMVHASDQGGLTWAGSGQIPASNSVRENQEYLDMPYRSSYMEALSTAVLPSKVSTFNAMKSGMIDSLNLLWSGDMDASKTIDTLYDELDTNLP